MLSAGHTQNISISGIANQYLRVDEVQTDRVRVTDVLGAQLSYFQPENKVMLIQMTGGELDDTQPDFLTYENRIRKTFNHAGAYEIFQVDQIITISATEAWIIFTDDVTRMYDSGEKIQLVRFVEGETVTTAGPVTARDWDGTVGGIVAIIGTDSLKLKDYGIDVSAKGFRGGAVPGENYNGICRYGTAPDAHHRDTLYFLPAQNGRSGNKGEGIITSSWPYTKGTGFALNGGGAGNGLYSGGGGGSNYMQGGDGGKQSPLCTNPNPALGGWGGYACYGIYNVSGSPGGQGIILGGGGGSGTRLSTSTPAKGGDGGGIVFLITGTLWSNGQSILANGESGAATTGSGGGGGAGGTVLIDATVYSGAITVRVNGGKGSNVTSTSYCTGSGGGGSGGVLWYSGTSIPATVDTAKGVQGTASATCLASGISGSPGAEGRKFSNLITPLTGFLFNSVWGVDTVCEGLQPKMLTASQPKGGDGTYIYLWEQSTDNNNWSDAVGVVAPRTFQPPALTQTTYYRRVVTSAGIFDTSRTIKIFVYPAITNNLINGTDTICYNSNAKLVTGKQPAGGKTSTYAYQWQARDNHSSWSNTGALLTANAPLDPGKLTESMYYRRIVTSTKYCHDTSNTEKITVLPLITDNGFITSDTSICTDQSPGMLNVLTPGGGDGIYTYSWQSNTLSGNWTSIPSSNVPAYTAGILTESTLYRRIVYSGNDNACIDTSAAKTVTTMPLISNNRILGGTIQYTCYNTPITLTGSDPQNGFGTGTYSYSWEQSSNNTDWESVTGAEQHLTTLSLTAAKYFRRNVYSTPEFHECTDVSDAVEVRINPLPTGDVLNSNDTVCAGVTLYVKFNVAGNSPFNVTVQGEGLPNQSKSGIVSSKDSVAFVPPTSKLFTMYSVEDDSGCFADINGFEGVTHGIVYAVPVADAGDNTDACGTSATLQAVKSVAGSEGLWTGTDVSFDAPESTNSAVAAEAYGTSVLTWTENNWHCSDADEVEVTFYEPPQAPDAGPDQVLDFSYTTQLEAAAPPVGSGKWTLVSGAGVFNNDTLPDAVISELSGANELQWTVTNGKCPPVSDNMEIAVEPLEITKGFTPNGDANHDYFEIGAANAERISIKIFNSAGILVFESDDYKEGNLWDGHNPDGVESPEGTYFYLIDMKVAGKEETVQFRSFVEILR